MKQQKIEKESLNIRVPVEIKRQLKEGASRSNLSLESYITAILGYVLSKTSELNVDLVPTVEMKFKG